MYRAIALAVLEAGLRPDDAAESRAAWRAASTCELVPSPRGDRVLSGRSRRHRTDSDAGSVPGGVAGGRHSGRPRSFGGAAKAAGGAGRGRDGRPGHRHRRLARRGRQIVSDRVGGRAGAPALAGTAGGRSPPVAGHRFGETSKAETGSTRHATFRRCARRRTPSKSIRPTNPWTKWSSWSCPSFGRS